MKIDSAEHHCNSQRTSCSLFDIMYLDFYKGIYIVYLILFFDTFYKSCATMNVADCELQYNNNIIHN